VRATSLQSLSLRSPKTGLREEVLFLVAGRTHDLKILMCVVVTITVFMMNLKNLRIPVITASSTAM
jgi:hypothetical protein